MICVKEATISALEYICAILTVLLLSFGILNLLGAMFALAVRAGREQLLLVPQIDSQSLLVPDRL